VETGNYAARLMRTARLTTACAVLAAGVAITAAPATASPAPTAAPKGSCKLLTIREVGQVLDTPAGAGKRVSNAQADSCSWAAKKKGTGGLKGQPLKLEITVATGQVGVDAYQKEKAAKPSETQPVPGLGDDAYTRDLDLAVLSGDNAMVVELHNYRYPKPLTEEQIQQKEADAAKLALGRLSPA
jgi:hypothetical protein